MRAVREEGGGMTNAEYRLNIQLRRTILSSYTIWSNYNRVLWSDKAIMRLTYRESFPSAFIIKYVMAKHPELRN